MLDAEHRPDVILMDISMPGLDGVDATRQIIDARPGAPTFGHPDRNAWLARSYLELRTTVLQAVDDPAEQALMIEEWDRGRLSKALLKEVQKPLGMVTKTADRPNVSERRTNCQEFRLAEVRGGATVDDAIAALDSLRTNDPSGYARLMYRPGARDTETLKKYWRAIEIAVRNAARKDGAVARAAKGAQKPAP